MRIITGKWRGRALETIDSRSTRPMRDRIKGSVFNMIQSRVAGSKVLDLFAGSGALGIECLSRDASFVVFCEKNPEAVKVIQKNLRGIPENTYSVYCEDYLQVLAKCKDKGLKFDIVFLDPPFASDFAEQALNWMHQYKLLAPGACIVWEHQANKILQEIEKSYIITLDRTYGVSQVKLLEHE